jgi:hypothetical protein
VRARVSRRSVRAALFAVLALAASAVAGPAAAQAAAPSIALHVSATHVHSGHSVTVSGTVPGAAAGTPVTVDDYAYGKAARPLSTVTSDATGDFHVVADPERTSWFRAVATVAGTRLSSAMLKVSVADRTTVRVGHVSFGRAAVTILVYHPKDLQWDGVVTRWRFVSGGQTTAAQSHTKRLSRYVTMLRVVVALPAGHFSWRVCFYGPDDQALLDAGRPSTCKGRGYSGRGWLPNGFPFPRSVAAASAYLAHRAGRTAFAVIDSEGRMSGVHMHWTFVSASVVKAMLLVAYLRRLDALGQHDVDATSNSFLYPMINVSDNSAATHTWSIVGDSGLYGVARAAGMTDFSIVGIWANAQISAADQARFFFEMDSLIPREFVGYARRLLSTIAGYESWGIPAVARPFGYTVFFKGGWRGTVLGQLVHQVGRLEGHGRTFSIAVMTDGNPSMGYGIDTIQGVTRALLG